MAIKGFCSVLVNDSGPVQLKVIVPGLAVDEVRRMVSPLQMGVLLPAIGVAGVLSIITKTVSAPDLQPFSEAVTK